MPFYINIVRAQRVVDIMDRMTYAHDTQAQTVNPIIQRQYATHSAITRAIESKENANDDELDVLPLARATTQFILNAGSFPLTPFIQEQLTAFVDRLLLRVAVDPDYPDEVLQEDTDDVTYIELMLNALGEEAGLLEIPQLLDILESLVVPPFANLRRIAELSSILEGKISESLSQALNFCNTKNLHALLADPRIVASLTADQLDMAVLNEFDELVPIRDHVAALREQDLNPLVAILTPSEVEANFLKPIANIFNALEIPYKFTILGPRNTQDNIASYVDHCKRMGIRMLIAGSVDLESFLNNVAPVHAGVSKLPIIALPLDLNFAPHALAYPTQTASGVMMVGINDAQNAALCCANILRATHPQIGTALQDYFNITSPLTPNTRAAKAILASFKNEQPLSLSEPKNEEGDASPRLAANKVS